MPPEGEFDEAAHAVPTVVASRVRAAARGPVRAGDFVGDYEILGELGHGGMGVVYKARHLRLRRVAALKFLRGGGDAGPESLARFRAEAEAVARLSHPNIVQVYEVGEDAGRPFLALEYCEGGTLERRLAGGPLPPREAAALVEKLARAAHAAHLAGVVHRDLKPANVLLAGDRTPKVADFGLARRLDGAGGHTRTGVVMGSPSYMAPEQARGLREVGPAADVWALGAVLYECLAGRPPFLGPTAFDTVALVVGSEPARLADAPPDLGTICLKCLSKEPSRRYGSAAELAADLGRYLAGEPVHARPLGRLESALRLIRRNPRVASLTAAVALLLLALTAVSVVGATTYRRAAAEADRQREIAERAVEDGREKLWASYLATARANRLTKYSGQRFDSLDAIGRAAAIRPTPELRDEAVACLALADIRPAKAAPPIGGLAADYQKGRVTFRRDGREVFRSPQADVHSHAASPDGRTVALFHDVSGKRQRFRVDLWDIASGRRAAAGIDHQFDTCQGWAAEGRVRLFDRRTGECRADFALGEPVGSRCAAHPNGRWLAVASPGRVEAFDLATGEALGSWARPAAKPVSQTTWHPARPWLLVNSHDAEMYDMRTGRRLWESRSQSHFLAAVTDDGAAVVQSGWGGLIEMLDPASGAALVSASGRADSLPPGGVTASHMTPRRFEVASPSLRRSLPDRVFDFGRPGDFSPDGKLLALAGGDEVELYDLATHTAVGSLAAGHCGAVRFSPDGSALWTYGVERGLLRWPLRGGEAGPPEEVGVRPNAEWRKCTWMDLAGDRVIASMWAEGRVVVLGPGGERRELALRRPRSVALSPDGRFAAVGTWKGPEAAVFDLRSGEKALGWKLDPIGEGCQLALSPDGRWLAMSENGKTTFHRVGRWDEKREFAVGGGYAPCQAAFSGDGRFVAIRDESHTVALLRADTLERVALLPSAERGGTLTGLALSRDGRWLLAQQHGSCKLWDLAGVRAELEKMGLAFRWPAY